MCAEFHTRYPHCIHTRFQKWTYCALNIHTPTPLTGRACSRYRRKVKRAKKAGVGARECQDCAMDRKIREHFGGGDSEGRRWGKRLFWKSGEVEMVVDVAMKGDLEAWPALEMMPVVLPGVVTGGDGGEEVLGKGRGKSSSSLFSRTSWGRFGTNEHGGGVLRWMKAFVRKKKRN